MVNNIVLENMNSYGVHGRIGLNGETFNLNSRFEAEEFITALNNHGVSAKLIMEYEVLSETSHCIEIEGVRFHYLSVEEIIASVEGGN